VAQESRPLEIIFIDDHSNDQSVKRIETSGIRVKLIHTDGSGGGARNAGVNIAKADWLAFLYSDDIWYPNHLSRAVQLIQTYNVIGYINHYE